MKEFVLVEFVIKDPIEVEALILREKLLALGDDFQLIGEECESEEDEDGNYQCWSRVSGRISSAYASLIKLQDQFLAERMRISYIPEDLKDKYRTKK